MPDARAAGVASAASPGVSLMNSPPVVGRRRTGACAGSNGHEGDEPSRMSTDTVL